jgi:Na+/glutamate symporter
MIVQMNVAALVNEHVAKHTEIDEDSIPLTVGSMIAGHVVANQTDKFTNPMIEKAASRIAQFKNRKNTES